MSTDESDRSSLLIREAAALEKAGSEEELLRRLSDTLRQVGIEHWIYVTVAVDGGSPILLANIDLHDESETGVFDPFLDYCCESYEATLTGIEFLDDHPYLGERDRNFIRKAARMGFRSGLGLPVRTVGSSIYGGFNLGTGLDREAFEREIVPLTEALRSFCLIAHRTIEALAKAMTGENGARSASASRSVSDLTKREVDILSRLARGASRRSCATELGISEHTVAAHARNIYDKLGVNNRVEAASIAIAAGVIPSPQ